MMIEQIKQVLREKFGYDGFRPLQAEIIEDVLVGGSRFVVLPTGGGKSLAYLLPAHLLKGMTLVVSPLIALMEDQLKRALDVGLRAAIWSRDICFEDLQIVFVSPEKLCSLEARNKLRELPVDHFVIDEVHSVVGWGSSFRPFYGLLKDVISLANPKSISLFSATVEEIAKLEIIKKLGLFKVNHFNGGFDRANIAFHRVYSVIPEIFVAKLLNEVRGKTIIYCGSRKKVEAVSLLLLKYGHQAAPYHAGLKRERRMLLQKRFKNGEFSVLCATSAFGMGVDIPDIRNVVHLQVPNNLKEYYQEVGRAGRDNKKALALLLIKPAWEKKKQKLIGELIFDRRSQLPNVVIREKEFMRNLSELVAGSYAVESLYAFLLYYEIYVRIVDETGVSVIPVIDWKSKLKYSCQIEKKKMSISKLWVNKFVKGSVCNRSILLKFFQEEVELCGGCHYCGSEYSQLLQKIEERVEKATRIINRLQSYSLRNQVKIINQSSIGFREKKLLEAEVRFLKKIG